MTASTIRQTVTLTPAQAAAATAEAQQLVELTNAQLREHQIYLTHHINMITVVTWHAYLTETIHGVVGKLVDQYRDTLLLQVQDIRIGSVRVEPRPDRPALISIVYEYPDELFAFLSDARTPAVLRNTLAGGLALGDEDQALTSIEQVR